MTISPKSTQGLHDAHVLAVNAGSTSVKVTRFIGRHEAEPVDDLEQALHGSAPDFIVHRVVHGGPRTAPTLLDDAEVAHLQELIELAPLHQPPALEAIDHCRQQWPHVPQVACFDTAFHATLPEPARTFALPTRLRNLVRVYGFHGLSHAWSSRQIAITAPQAERVLIAHLGGGQSLCGVIGSRSVVTTMGFTPLDGLVMATRSGTVDSGALLWLAKHTDEDLDKVLETESGLLGLTGTADMKVVTERAKSGDDSAQLALDIWLHRFLRQAGGCIAVLGGLDALVFTGGIGEHSNYIRTLVTEKLEFLGVRYEDRGDDPEPSAGRAGMTAEGAVKITGEGAVEMTGEGAAVRTFVVHAREDRQMLLEASDLLSDAGDPR